MSAKKIVKKLEIKKVFELEKPLTKWDILLFLLIAVVCFFTFEHTDILHTAGSSFGYLNGHFLDFYEYNASFGLYDSYMPSTYLTFALWNIPLKLFGIIKVPTQVVSIFVIMWYKLLPVGIYMVTGYLVYRIALEIGMGSRKAKLCTYAYLTMPIGFFSQFIFGQYDVFTLFFMLLGYYYYLKGRDRYFILFFALAIPYKYFALLIFIPLLLLKEKNVWRILRNVVLAAIPYALEFLIYGRSEVFRDYVLGFGVTDYAFAAGLFTGGMTLKYLVLAWILVAAWAYFQRPDQKNEIIKWSLYLTGMVGLCIFGLSQWHPQWLLLIIPFFVLSAFIHKDTGIFMIIDLLWMVFFVLYTVNYWNGRVDENLLNYGVFGPLVGSGVSYKTTIRDMLLIRDMDLLNTGFTFLLMVSAVFKHPRFCLDDFRKSADHCMAFIRVRFIGGLSVFLVPAMICFILALTPPYMTFKVTDAYEHIYGMIDRQISQIFVPKKGVVRQIEFMLGTFGRSNDVTLYVSVVDADTNETAFITEIETKGYTENVWITVDTGNLMLQPEKAYRIDFTCYEGDADNCVTLFRSQDLKSQKNGYAMEGGVPLPYNLCLKIIESN